MSIHLVSNGASYWPLNGLNTCHHIDFTIDISNPYLWNNAFTLSSNTNNYHTSRTTATARTSKHASPICSPRWLMQSRGYMLTRLIQRIRFFKVRRWNVILLAGTSSYHALKSMDVSRFRQILTGQPLLRNMVLPEVGTFGTRFERLLQLWSWSVVVVVVVVVVVFTLNRSFYPATSAVLPVSLLILHPWEIQFLWSQAVRQRKTKR